MRKWSRLGVLILAVSGVTGCDRGSGKSPAPAPAPTITTNAAPVSTGSGPAYEISPRYQPGETFYVEFYQDVSSTISEVGAPDVPTGLIRRYGMQVKVESISPTGAEFSFKLDRASHGKRSMMVKKDFDSDDPAIIDDIGMLETYTPLLGLAFKAKLDPQFHATAIEDVDIFEAKVRESKFGPIAIDAGRDFSGERLKMVWVEYPRALYPDHPVKVGDSWTNIIIENFPIGKVELPHVCKLEKVTEENGRKTALISFEGVMKRLDKNFAKLNDIQVKSYDFSFKGEAIYDFGVGQIVSRTQNNRTTYQYPGRSATPGGAPPLQTIRVIANQTYRMLSVEQRAAEKAKHLRESKPTTQPASSPPGH